MRASGVEVVFDFDLWDKLSTARAGRVLGLRRTQVTKLRVNKMIDPTEHPWVSGEAVQLNAFGMSVVDSLPSPPTLSERPTSVESARSREDLLDELTSTEVRFLSQWAADVREAIPTGERSLVEDSWKRSGRFVARMAKLLRLGYVTMGTAGVYFNTDGEVTTDYPRSLPTLVWRRTDLGMLIS